MDRLDRAIAFATQAHAGQVRKVAKTPFILHPLEVATIVATMTDDENVMIAGLLHDTIEDAGVELHQIREEFGSRVAALVASETEDRFSKRPAEETWKERKVDSLLVLKQTKERDVKVLWLADKLSNMRSFYRTHLVQGDAMWHYFHQQNKSEQAWYYGTIAELVAGELGETSAFKEYDYLRKEVFEREIDDEE